LFDSVAGDKEAVQLGRRLNQLFAAGLNGRSGPADQPSLQKARLQVDRFLGHFPPAQQRRILRGALVSIYQGDMLASDAVAWLAGERAMPTSSSLAQRTVQALREIGMLDDLLLTKVGVVVYPTEIYT
jgi:hypothetical protein